MAAREQYTAEQVAQAIIKAQGILVGAAQALGCSRQTVDNYIKKYKTAKDAYQEANEITIDFVESALLKNIKKGDTTAMIFFLKTKAKHRGYVERQEMTGKDGGPVQTESTVKPDLSKLTVDELLQLRTMVAKATDAATDVK